MKTIQRDIAIEYEDGDETQPIYGVQEAFPELIIPVCFSRRYMAALFKRSINDQEWDALRKWFCEHREDWILEEIMTAVDDYLTDPETDHPLQEHGGDDDDEAV